MAAEALGRGRTLSSAPAGCGVAGMAGGEVPWRRLILKKAVGPGSHTLGTGKTVFHTYGFHFASPKSLGTPNPERSLLPMA